MRPAKVQVSLRFRAVWSESSTNAFWIAKNAKFLHADNKDSDQTAWMRRLIWVLVGRTCQKIPFRMLCLTYWCSKTRSKPADNHVVLTLNCYTAQIEIGMIFRENCRSFCTKTYLVDINWTVRWFYRLTISMSSHSNVEPSIVDSTTGCR